MGPLLVIFERDTKSVMFLASKDREIVHFFRMYTFLVKYSIENISVMVKWAASWQNQHSAFATSMDPDQPAHPRSLIRIHAVRLQTLLQVEKLIANWSQTHYVGFVMTCVTQIGRSFRLSSIVRLRPVRAVWSGSMLFAYKPYYK
jgi:hypothetical protein